MLDVKELPIVFSVHTAVAAGKVIGPAEARSRLAADRRQHKTDRSGSLWHATDAVSIRDATVRYSNFVWWIRATGDERAKKSTSRAYGVCRWPVNEMKLQDSKLAPAEKKGTRRTVVSASA